MASLVFCHELSGTPLTYDLDKKQFYKDGEPYTPPVTLSNMPYDNRGLGLKLEGCLVVSPGNKGSLDTPMTEANAVFVCTDVFGEPLKDATFDQRRLVMEGIPTSDQFVPITYFRYDEDKHDEYLTSVHKKGYTGIVIKSVDSKRLP
jgi:hypothetical protein